MTPITVPEDLGMYMGDVCGPVILHLVLYVF